MSSVKKNITIHRGDYSELKFKIFGDYTSKKLYFTVKADKTITSERIIDLSNSAAGGSDAEISASYDNTYTTVIVKLNDINTYNLDSKQYYYDLTENDGTKETTLFDGDFNLDFDVRTVFDGFAMPATEARFQQVDATAMQENELMQVAVDARGNKYMKGITITELKTLLGI